MSPSLATRGKYNVLSRIRGEMKYWAVSDLNLAELSKFSVRDE
jgi:hypothetical protein